MAGRPLQGTEKKKTFSVKLEPKVQKEIIDKYGTLANFINEMFLKNIKIK